MRDSISHCMKKNSGFTLVELIVAIAALVILIMAMTPLITVAMREVNEITMRTRYQNAAANIISDIRARVGECDFAAVVNDSSAAEKAKVDTSAWSNVSCYENSNNYRELVYNVGGSKSTVVTSSDVNGKLIKVDFACNSEGAPNMYDDKRLSMLYVLVSFYDGDADMSYFDSHPTYTADDIMEYTEPAPGSTDNPPKPVYQQRTGIYLINIAYNIVPPVSKKDLVIKALEDAGAFPLKNPDDPEISVTKKAVLAAYYENPALDIQGNPDGADLETYFNVEIADSVAVGADTKDYAGNCLMFSTTYNDN